MEYPHQEVTKNIIGSAFEVHNTLGYGFLEKVYHKALQVELLSRGFTVEMEKQIHVSFKGHTVGEYYADLLVNEEVVVELKAAKEYNPADEAQLINQLKGSGMKVGLLINFGKEGVKHRRFVN